jgi:ribosome modulation factor
MITIADARYKGYRAAQDGKPRDCRYNTARLRVAWHDGYDCFLNETAVTTVAAPEVRDSTLAMLKGYLK